MENKKYFIDTDTMPMIFRGVKFNRIRALKDFGDVKAGELGGWIEKEENLSQEGECWVYGQAVVMDNAQITDNAKIYDMVLMCKDAKIDRNIKIYGDAVITNDITFDTTFKI